MSGFGPQNRIFWAYTLTGTKAMYALVGPNPDKEQTPPWFPPNPYGFHVWP
jgi:hypothetical protein